MSRHDIVYVLKNDYNSEELKYSVRSVVQNFPYRKIVFIGGHPDDMTADILIPHKQEGTSKWRRSMSSLKLALENNQLTEDIWLFNDDFFVMDRVTEDVNYFCGSLEKRVSDIRQKVGLSTYARELELLRGFLIKENKDTLSFSLHIPFLINRAKALALMESFPSQKMFRSLYGNYYKIDCRFMEDVKVIDRETLPDTPFISTSDDSFKNGKVGEFLRKYFDTPSKYELNRGNQQTIYQQTRERYDEEGEERKYD